MAFVKLIKKANSKKLLKKPKSKIFVNTGFIYNETSNFNLIPKNRFFHMTQLIELAKKKKFKVAVYPIRDNDWIDIGQLSNYTNIQEQLDNK